MVKKRPKRNGPKSSKPLDEKSDDSNEEPETAADKSEENEEEMNSADASSGDPEEGSSPQLDDPLKAPSVSSPTENQSEKDLAEEAKKVSEESNISGARMLSEKNQTLIDAPEEKLDEIVELVEPAAEINAVAPEDDDKEKKIDDPAEPASGDELNVESKFVLRLVPLTQLLKPEVLDTPAIVKTKTLRKTTVRNKKNYIEISSESEEAEQISLSSDSDSEDEFVAKKLSSKHGRDAGSSKENNGTNNKLSNGVSKKTSFKEPMTSSKFLKNTKDFSVNLEKMPNNVNKLMKCYRVDESRIESWSDPDDFENMISMSKIDRIALHKSKSSEKLEEPVELPQKIKKVKKTNKFSEDEVVVSERRTRPERNSARNAKLKTKSVIEFSEIAKTSSSSDENEPLNVKSSTKKLEPSNTKRARRSVNPSVSDIASPSKGAQVKLKPPPTDNSSSCDENKLFKKKTKGKQDDHFKEKTSKKSRDKSTSSEDEMKSIPLKSRSIKTKEVQVSKPTKSNKESTSTKTRVMSRRKKSNNLKVDSSLKDSSETTDEQDKKKTKTSHNSDDSLMSSFASENDRVMQPIKLGESLKSRHLKKKSSSESEVESSETVDKDPDPDDFLIKIDESNSETEEKKSPVLDQKLRNRNKKFDSNSAFQSLKEKIEKRKIKQKFSSDDEESKSSAATAQRKLRLSQNGHINNSENNNNKDDEASADEDTDSSIARAKRQAAKRKRLLSSSEEEQENGDNKTPQKKKKMSSTEDTDYEAGSGDEKMKDSDEEKSEAESKNDSDSDDDGSEKPMKREKQDSSDYSETEDSNKKRTKDKKHKRIKKIASSDEDGENGDKSKSSGRKNIRKMMRADKLDVSTKEAAKIERERKQRIEERQKMYNQFYDERPEEAKEITKLVLDFDENSKKPLLQVDKKLVRKLKPHQANGVKFMWDACFESLDRCEKDIGSGCILAHCMGLGKTLQVITLVHTLLKNTEATGISRALVVCPLSTVLNWVNEFNIWLKDIEGREDIYVYEINKLKQNVDRANKLMEWHNDGGIMILSYDMFRNLTNDTGSRFRKKIKESLQTSLLDPGPDLVICDEGHLLKNEKTSISKAMMRLRTLRRIVLTGTPLQNNLKEYYCMVQFVKPNLLGKYQEYLNRFVNPITNGQYTDSTDYDIQIMRRRAHVLHKMLDGCVQRRDYSVLAPFLPPKHEYVISIKLTPMQVKLYKYYMEKKSRSNEENGGRKGSILFQDFQNLQRIWTAPLVLRYNSNRYEVEMQRRKDLESEEESEGSLKDFIDDSESAASTSSSSSEDQSDDDAISINSDEPKKKKKKKQKHAPAARRTRAKAADFPSDHEADEAIVTAVKKENPTEWWMQICPEEELNNLEHSSKLMLLVSILEECEAIGDKLLVFSQSLYSLDVIEHFLNYIDERTQMNAACSSFTGSWSLGQDYFRLDGSTPVEQRNASCKHFNSVSNPRARLFLISTRAGGLGINLVAANRVIIFDVSWNPSHDIQSIFRVYRFGQNKPCYVYRFLAMGTMEEKIYERQVTKQAISKRVIDEQQIDRHYNQNDLQELYTYDLEPDDERILPILPKDRLFAEMLKKFENMIYKYHEHDTLLENKEEETLGEDERKQAWEEFEAEKNRPQFVSQYIPQQPRGIGPVTSNNIFGIRTDVLLKLLSMKARLDNPQMSDSSVKQAIPLLMQELYRQMDRGELTLYQQLLALSSSLEVPQNYGGQFRVNENMMLQTYHSMNSMPSTSSTFQSNASILQRQQLVDRQQQLMRYAQQQQRQQILSQQLKRKSPPRIVGSVIEID